MALRVMRFVGMKVAKGLLPALRERSMVAVVRIEAVIHMAIKPAMAVIPGTSPDKYPSGEPIRPVETIWRAVIRGIVEVAIWTHRRNADIDGYLRRRTRRAAQDTRRKSRKCKNLQITHSSSTAVRAQSAVGSCLPYQKSFPISYLRTPRLSRKRSNRHLVMLGRFALYAAEKPLQAVVGVPPVYLRGNHGRTD
jgi:hypothetical protein